MQKRWLALLFTIFFLSACSQTGRYPIYQVKQPEIVFSDWYIRGVFNWWEAKAAYQLKEGNNGWFVDVELIADDQPYDFKFSNATWTTDQTCGANYKGLVVALNQATSLTCGAASQNLRFTPPKTATYRFTVKGSPNSSLLLSVTMI